MREVLAELAEPLLVVLYGAVVSVLAIAGAGAELAGLTDLFAGGGFETTSMWLVYIGAVGIVAAVVVARRRLLPLVTSRS